MDGGAGYVQVAADVVALAAQAAGTKMKIDEGKADYQSLIDQANAKIGETQAEAARRIGTTKAEGVAGIDEMARQNAYEAGVASAQAQMVASQQTAKLGASGVRAAGSPNMAAHQAASMARAAAENKIDAGNAAVSMGGLKLGNQIADINAASLLTTNELTRQRKEAERKKKYLEDNAAAMIAISAAGGAAGLASDFADHLE